MQLTADKQTRLRDGLLHRLEALYGVEDSDVHHLDRCLEEGIHRTLQCFGHLKNKYYRQDDIRLLHTGQQFIFLYYLSNTVFHRQVQQGEETARDLCDKLYGFNRTTASCDLFYEVEMPEYFMIDHPVGSVIGRARIGKGFGFIQGCTVGVNKGIYPTLGDHVMMFSNSKIVGNCRVGNNVLISANAYIKDMDIPDNSVVYGQYPNVTVKSGKEELIRATFEEQFV